MAPHSSTLAWKIPNSEFSLAGKGRNPGPVMLGLLVGETHAETDECGSPETSWVGRRDSDSKANGTTRLPPC